MFIMSSEVFQVSEACVCACVRACVRYTGHRKRLLYAVLTHIYWCILYVTLIGRAKKAFENPPGAVFSLIKTDESLQHTGIVVHVLPPTRAVGRIGQTK